MAAPSDNTSGFAAPRAHSQIRLDVFYQNVRRCRTKQVELHDTVSSTDYNVMCLIET
jgi:hypothetical protein